MIKTKTETTDILIREETLVKALNFQYTYPPAITAAMKEVIMLAHADPIIPYLGISTIFKMARATTRPTHQYISILGLPLPVTIEQNTEKIDKKAEAITNKLSTDAAGAYFAE